MRDSRAGFPMLIRGLWPRARLRLRALRPLHSTWALSRSLVELARDPARSPAEFDRLYATRDDPWNYASGPDRERHEMAAGLLGRARTSFDTALEIGCAEGRFTELLASKCRALTAVDFSPLAVERAARRLAGTSHVAVKVWNVRTDPLDCSFELVVAMDVLSTILRPCALRRAIDKIATAVAPGGLLLITDVRQKSAFEMFWWGRALGRGGTNIVSRFRARHELEIREYFETRTHVFALFEKVPRI